MHEEGVLPTTNVEVALVAVRLRPGLAFLLHVFGVYDAHHTSVFGDEGFLLSFTFRNRFRNMAVAFLNVVREVLLLVEHAAAELAGKNVSVPVALFVRRTSVVGD